MKSEAAGSNAGLSSDAPARRQPRLALLGLGALGIVYGDIGTSPLYALRECFVGRHSVAATPENVLGILSLIFWSLLLIVSVKYLLCLLRIDNDGEGGILALMALVRAGSMGPRMRAIITALGLFGAALLYGDGMLTPAISVLSALEGLSVAAPFFTPYIVPLAVMVLIFLFIFQKRGTEKIGAFFGPIMLVWFASIAALGVKGILAAPQVLSAVSPLHAAHFFIRNGMSGFLVLGAVFLVVTGSEALYADLGHFSRKPIQLAWFCIAAPALILNYFGQGGLLVAHGKSISNPFFLLAPSWALYPLVLLSTSATVIASQAIISGVFSLTYQAMRMGYLPRVNTVHTSWHEKGQIYIPVVNGLLLVAAVGLVLSFRSSGSLAGAYGIAVALTMVITMLLAFVALRRLLHWSLPAALAVAFIPLMIDCVFLGANAFKVVEGGWVPLVIAGGIVGIFLTWKAGSGWLAEKDRHNLPLEKFIEEVGERGVQRVSGTAVIFNSDALSVPAALLHNVKHNKILHEFNVITTIVTEDTPRVDEERRLVLEDLGDSFARMRVSYGFMECPDIPMDMFHARERGLDINPLMATYILSHITLLGGGQSHMTAWRKNLFMLMFNNAIRVPQYFRLPHNRVIEIGRQIRI